MADKAASLLRRGLQFALDAVLLVDQRPYARRLSVRPQLRVVLVVQPQEPPEPPAAPRAWRELMRDNWLSNRIFKSYAAIVDHCCEAWNKLIDQPWRIMSIGMREWANEF